MRIWMAVALGVGLAVTAAAAFATPKDGMTFTQVYAPKAGTAVAGASCALCHTKGAAPSATALNPYGADLAKQKTRDAVGFRAIQKLDSDRDGFSNIAEIRSGTLPGDPTSKPVK